MSFSVSYSLGIIQTLAPSYPSVFAIAGRDYSFLIHLAVHPTHGW